MSAPMTPDRAALEAKVYESLVSFNGVACWDILRLAQMRQYLAEHVAADLAPEVDRLRARVAELESQRDRRRGRLVALQNDALNMRGSLAPADEGRKVPFELGETLTPAVDWLIARVAELEVELADQQRTTRYYANQALRRREELAARPSSTELFAEFAHDVETAIAPLTGDARAGADMVLQVIRAKAAEATVPMVEATS